tara:strand:- start:247 stop:1524 length:1278 start_codon:yes stop_codon:yes gene_type:complete
MLLKQTEEYLNTTKLKDRKSKGQYFTPKQIKDKSLDGIQIENDMLILENSCGTGEFIHSILKLNPNVHIDAYDIDQPLIDLVESTFPCVRASCEDWLLSSDNTKYDKIIGNPPYYEMSKAIAKKKGYERFAAYSKSKPNIYSFFIIKSIESLKEGGELIYVVPTSMNNGHAFLPMRKFIIEKCNIEAIDIFSDSDFEDALQNTMTIRLTRLRQGQQNNGKFIFKKDSILIFSDAVDSIKELFKGKFSLKELGFEVKTGNYVWNQNKNFMSFDVSDTILLWACNIEKNRLKLYPENSGDNLKLGLICGPYEEGYEKSSREQKAQHVSGCADKRKPLKERSIIVNRVTGCGVRAQIRAALVDINQPYYTENHINCITETKETKMTLTELHRKLISQETSQILRHISGNTQLSKKELLNLIPISLDKT